MPHDAVDFEATYTPVEIEADWITALDERLGWHDLPRSYRLIAAVLRGLHANIAGASIDGERLIRAVAADFRPDRLDNPISAVLATLDGLEEATDDPTLEAVRRILLQSSIVPAFALPRPTWSAAGSNPA